MGAGAAHRVEVRQDTFADIFGRSFAPTSERARAAMRLTTTTTRRASIQDARIDDSDRRRVRIITSLTRIH